MLGSAERERYLRHILLKEVGAQGQLRLKSARAVVVGAGGLGSPVIQYLAAAGVGRLDIVDDDVVSLSNLQRQVVYGTDDIGLGKAERAAAAATRINPHVVATAHAVRLDEANARTIFEGADIVIEGVDSFAARHAINRAAIAAKAPLVSAAIGRFDGQLAVFAPFAGDLPCYRCFVAEPPPDEAARTCEAEGVLGPLAGVVGAMAALEALKILARFGEPLAGRLLIYDGLSHRMRMVTLRRDPACPDCAGLAR